MGLSGPSQPHPLLMALWAPFKLSPKHFGSVLGSTLSCVYVCVSLTSLRMGGPWTYAAGSLVPSPVSQMDLGPVLQPCLLFSIHLLLLLGSPRLN